MKKQTNQFSQLSNGHLEKLTAEVNETMAFELNHVKVFSPADLWNIQRRGKTMLQRRYCL